MSNTHLSICVICSALFFFTSSFNLSKMYGNVRNSAHQNQQWKSFNVLYLSLLNLRKENEFEWYALSTISFVFFCLFPFYKLYMHFMPNQNSENGYHHQSCHCDALVSVNVFNNKFSFDRKKEKKNTRGKESKKKKQHQKDCYYA